MNDFELVDSVLIIYSHINFVLNSLRQFISQIVAHPSQIISLSVVSSETVLHMRSQSLQISLVQLTDLDLHQFYFSFVMLDDFLDFPFEFFIVRLDITQPFILIHFQFSVQHHQSLDFGLLGLDDFLQTVNISIIEFNQT
jgi:hypothetical protein